MVDNTTLKVQGTNRKKVKTEKEKILKNGKTDEVYLQSVTLSERNITMSLLVCVFVFAGMNALYHIHR